jgi:hypothetical protein
VLDGWKCADQHFIDLRPLSDYLDILHEQITDHIDNLAFESALVLRSFIEDNVIIKLGRAYFKILNFENGDLQDCNYYFNITIEDIFNTVEFDIFDEDKSKICLAPPNYEQSFSELIMIRHMIQQVKQFIIYDLS